MSRLTGSDRSPLYQHLPCPDRRPRTLPPLRTPFLEHLPPQADECKTLAYDLLELPQRRSCNDLIQMSLRNSDAVQWFFDIIIWKYTRTINTKSWVKDVIQGFAQKAVKLNTKKVLINNKNWKKDKTRETPRNSRQNFRNSREFSPGILGVRDSREFPNGNSWWPWRGCMLK